MFFHVEQGSKGLYAYKAIILSERIERGWNYHQSDVMIVAMHIQSWTYFFSVDIRFSCITCFFFRILTGTSGWMLLLNAFIWSSGVSYKLLCYLYVLNYYNMVKIIDAKKKKNKPKPLLKYAYNLPMVSFVFRTYPFFFSHFYYAFIMYLSAHKTRRNFIYINILQGKCYYTI